MSVKLNVNCTKSNAKYRGMQVELLWKGVESVREEVESLRKGLESLWKEVESVREEVEPFRKGVESLWAEELLQHDGERSRLWPHEDRSSNMRLLTSCPR